MFEQTPNQQDTLRSIALSPTTPTTVLAFTSYLNRIYASHDGGDTWIEDVQVHPVPGLGRDEGTWKKRIAGTLTGIVPTNTYRCGDGRYIVIGGIGGALIPAIQAMLLSKEKSPAPLPNRSQPDPMTEDTQ